MEITDGTWHKGHPNNNILVSTLREDKEGTPTAVWRWSTHRVQEGKVPSPITGPAALNVTLPPPPPVNELVEDPLKHEIYHLILK